MHDDDTTMPETQEPTEPTEGSERMSASAPDTDHEYDVDTGLSYQEYVAMIR